jgi:hypothetical protein
MSSSSNYIPKHVQQVDAGKDSRYRAVKEAKTATMAAIFLVPQHTSKKMLLQLLMQQQP